MLIHWKLSYTGLSCIFFEAVWLRHQRDVSLIAPIGSSFLFTHNNLSSWRPTTATLKCVGLCGGNGNHGDWAQMHDALAAILKHMEETKNMKKKFNFLNMKQKTDKHIYY